MGAIGIVELLQFPELCSAFTLIRFAQRFRRNRSAANLREQFAMSISICDSHNLFATKTSTSMSLGVNLAKLRDGSWSRAELVPIFPQEKASCSPHVNSHCSYLF